MMRSGEEEEEDEDDGRLEKVVQKVELHDKEVVERGFVMLVAFGLLLVVGGLRGFVVVFIIILYYFK